MVRKLYQYDIAQLSRNISYLSGDWFLFCKALSMASSLPRYVRWTLSHCLALIFAEHYPRALSWQYCKFVYPPTLPLEEDCWGHSVWLASVCVTTSPKPLVLLVSCHLIAVPLSCPIQPVWRWGDMSKQTGERHGENRLHWGISLYNTKFW